MRRISISTNVIIKKLNTIRYIVIVPAIAIVNKTKIESRVEETVFYEDRPLDTLHQDVRKHVMGNILSDEFDGIDTHVRFTPSRRAPGFYVDDKLQENTENEPTEAYLTLAEIVDIYHEGHYIRLKNVDDVMKLTTDLSSIMDLLETAIDTTRANEIITYIDEFYAELVGNKGKTITNRVFGNNTQQQTMVNHTKLIRKKSTIDDIAVKG